MARGRRRPNQGRNGPGDTTDDDVLGRCLLYTSDAADDA